MRTAHAPRHTRTHTQTVDVPKSERRRTGVTLPGLVGGMVGAFLGIFIGYAAGVAVMWLLQGRVPDLYPPLPSFWQAILRPGELALYTPLSIPLGFLIGGFLGEKIGRRFRRKASA